MEGRHHCPFQTKQNGRRISCCTARSAPPTHTRNATQPNPIIQPNTNVNYNMVGRGDRMHAQHPPPRPYATLGMTSSASLAAQEGVSQLTAVGSAGLELQPTEKNMVWLEWAGQDDHDAGPVAGPVGTLSAGGPRTCLMIKKPNDSPAATALLDIGRWLVGRGLTVLVEPKVLAEPSLLAAAEQWRGGLGEPPAHWLEPLPQQPAAAEARLEDVDFAICLGGDGTILWLSGLFRGRVRRTSGAQACIVHQTVELC